MAKLTSQEISDLTIGSLALANALVEKFELMIENNLLIHRSKQSVKNSILHLQDYINKIFTSQGNDAENLALWGDIVLGVQNKIDIALSTKEIIIISNRKELLVNILKENKAPDSIIDKVMKRVEETDILKF